jgi:hypothetical protein
MGGVLRQFTDRLERAPGGVLGYTSPANMLMQAPQQLASAPQQLKRCSASSPAASAATWLSKARRCPPGSPAPARQGFNGRNDQPGGGARAPALPDR